MWGMGHPRSGKAFQKIILSIEGFKGGLRCYERPAYDSETCERMMVYQALYGEHAYWVRPQGHILWKYQTRGPDYFKPVTVC